MSGRAKLLDPEKLEARAKKAAATRAYYVRNKEKVKARVSRWKSANRQRINANIRRKNLDNPVPEYLLLFRSGLKRCKACNLVKPRDMFSPNGKGGMSRLSMCRACRAEAISANPSEVLSRRIRASLRSRLRMGRNSLSMHGLGYSTDELRAHLERQFVRGMGWDNMTEWHIDHIVPLSSFGPDDVRKAWSLSNLRPVWAAENLRKGASREFLL